MSIRIAAIGLVGVLAWAAPGAGETTSSALPPMAFDERLDGPPVLAGALDETAAPRFPVMARLVATRRALEPEPGAYRFDRLEARLALYAGRGIPVWLVVESRGADGPRRREARVPDEGGSWSDEADRWRAFVRALAARDLSGVRVVELAVDGGAAALDAFRFKVAATEVRIGGEPPVVVLGSGAGAGPAGLQALYDHDLAPYADAVAVPASVGAAARGALTSALAERDPGAALLVTGVSLGGGGDEARRTVIGTELEALGSGVISRSYDGSPAAVAAALDAAGAIADLLAGALVPLDAEASALRLERDGRDVTAAVRHRLLYDVATLATYLVYWGRADAEGGLALSLTLPLEGTAVLRDPLAGARTPVEGYVRDPASGRVRARLPWRPGPRIVDFHEGAETIVADRADVAAIRSLRVEEIVARHQRWQAAQTAAVDHYTASVRMEQHFRPSMTDPGYLVVSENRYFAEGPDVEWEELAFSVNGTRWGPDRPPFPLLQAEKVLSLPLDLQLTDDYRYTLVGTAEVGGQACYVVRFEPRAGTRSLYRGTAWIDRERFALVKVQAVQTALSSPMVSNDEEHTFESVAVVDGRPIVLLTDLTSRQLVRLAGRNLLVERRVAFTDVRVNDPEFHQARELARRGDRVMYKETERGLRYFVKEGDERVVRDEPTRSARALAMGVTLDPSFAFPLPIVGLNYLDFAFGSPDTQLALLFGGVLVAGNLQWASVGPTPFDASLDLFAIAAPSSDRIYDEGGEREGERLLTWPMNLGVNLGHQFTDFQKAGLRYDLRFDAYANDRTTDEAFVRPRSTLTHGLGTTYEYRRAGYSLVAWGTWLARTRWHPWGYADRLTPAEAARTYVKYGALVARDVNVGLFHRLHVDAAYFGGRRLDRLSQYQFGLFDETRIRGVPASGLRFGELAALRGSYSFNIFEEYRLDLFLDRAWGRDETRSTDWQPITGVGASVNLRAPWRTILRAEVGKSVLPRAYRTLGSTVVQVLLLKPL